MSLVLPFEEIGPNDVAWVGGKGASLAALARAGLPVPPGLCVTTRAFREFVRHVPDLSDRLAELTGAQEVCGHARAVRQRLEATAIPTTLEAAIVEGWERLGVERGYAVRSSATAEDLPDASFAGQQDSFLNVVGRDALLEKVRACWASLFTERAVLYREQHGIRHADVAMSVVVQRMVLPEKSGVLFTADPITGHRKVTTIDAGFGLGEALVSGLISADLVKADTRSGKVTSLTVGDKLLAVLPVEGGGTVEQPLTEDRRRAQVLDGTEVEKLVDLGRRVEALQGSPQDIEWCIAGDEIFIVQARPITTLYPLLDPPFEDDSLHACFSVSHFQVMTDAMPPMATSLWRWLLPLGRMPGDPGPSPWTRSAGGRVYADVSAVVRRRPLRKVLLFVLTKGVDRLAALAIEQVSSRQEFERGPKVSPLNVVRIFLPAMAAMWAWVWFRRPEGATDRVSSLLDQLETEMAQRVTCVDGISARLRVATDYVSTLIWRLLHVPPMVISGLVAGRILRRLVPMTDDDFAALGRGLTGNVTTTMSLEVGDLADVVRRHPGLADALRQGDGTLDTLIALDGGAELRASLGAFLAQYGMRCGSEIDISRPRWRDDPSALLRTIAGALQAEAGHHRRRYRGLVEQAERAIERVLETAGRGPLGWLRRPLARRLMRVHRHMLPLREHPKYMLVRAFDQVRRLVLQGGAELVDAGRLDRVDDVWFLELQELPEVLDHAAHDVRPLIRSRRDAHARHQTLTPPRLLTSDGESPVVALPTEDLPDGALSGSPVSAGEIVGTARVITDPTRQVLHKGEILVAPFTDPGWTPLFINASGLVMEVGGLMTHGSVVAREYGIPAVVSVVDATNKIRTGQRIKVQGDAGYVQILDEDGTR